MSGLIPLLRELHRVHRQIRDLREHLDRLPVQLKAYRAKVTRAETALKDNQDALKLLKVSVHEKEVSLKSKAQQIEKYETQVNLVTSKKEYDALKLEIAHTKEACGKLEDEILLAMTQTDERTTALPALEKALKDVRDELASFESEARVKHTALSAESSAAQAALKEVEGKLPDDLRQQYDRAVRNFGADALVPARDRTCTSCSTEITPQQQTNLIMDRLVICTSCGRILYLSQ